MATKQRNKLDNVRTLVVEAYGNGSTMKEIADVYGTSTGTVRNLLQSEPGVSIRPRGRRKSKPEPAVLALEPETTPAPLAPPVFASVQENV